MANMKISVCITVFNEESSIGELLNSLINQTKKPDEIIIIDGLSQDRTVDVIKHYQKKDFRIKLVIEPGCVAHGRNVSIELARNSIVALTDAGCIAKPDWLAKISEPFKSEEVGMVAGFYEMPYNNSLQRAMNLFHGITIKQYEPKSFLPSARSVAFRKAVWEEVGGFNENLTKASEDTDYFYKLVKNNVKIVRVGKARVIWQETKSFTLKDSINKFYQYAKGDAQAGIWWHPTQKLASHNIKVVVVFIRYLIGIILLIYSFSHPITIYALILGLLIYVIWAYHKVYSQTKDIHSGYWGILIQFMSDFAVMTGFLSGITGRRIK